MATLNDEQKRFEAWLFVETYTIAMLILGNILFLGVRSIKKPAISVSTGDNDPFADFLSADESNVLLNLISKGICFMGTSVFLLVSANLS